MRTIVYKSMEFIYEKLNWATWIENLVYPQFLFNVLNNANTFLRKKSSLQTQDGNHGQQKNIEKLSTINTSHNLIFHFDLQNAWISSHT